MQLPLESLELILKSLNPAALESLSATALVSTFSSFIGPNSPRDPRFQAYLTQTDFGDTDPVDRPGGKLPAPRRFAGDHTLDRGRYYSICHNNFGDDDGTLVRELAAYVDPEMSPGMTIQEYLADEPRLKVSLEPGRNVLLEFFDGLREATLPLRVEIMELDGVLDLRKPSVQDWFVETFREPDIMQGDPEAGFDGVDTSADAIKPQWRKPLSFFDMLPVLMSFELGGTRTGQIIGLKLRSWGCKALIFPSARNAVGVGFDEGRIVSSRGWNLVRYAPPIPPAVRYKHYQLDPWKPTDLVPFNISVEQDGRFKGSWLVKPALLKHELHMKLRYFDRLPLEALWPNPNDFPEIVPAPPITEEEFAKGDAFAFAKVREEFKRTYDRLGPGHEETRRWATWLEEHDPDWYVEFLESTGRSIEE